MKLTVKDIQGNSQGELEVQFPIIEDGRGAQAVHQTVVAYRAAQRNGTACTKTMGEVTGTGKKPWRQKGTGRARAGSFQSPLWRGGGVVFGPKPRDFRQKVSKSIRQLALCKALSERLKTGEVLVVDQFKLSAPKTRDFLKILKTLQLTGTLLLVVDKAEPNLLLASRNVPGVSVVSGQSLNAFQVLRFDKLLFTKDALTQVDQRLAKA
jgi:large subunit ribosomal protein L4